MKYVYRCLNCKHLLTFKRLLSDGQAKDYLCPKCANKGVTYDHTEVKLDD